MFEMFVHNFLHCQMSRSPMPLNLLMAWSCVQKKMRKLPMRQAGRKEFSSHVLSATPQLSIFCRTEGCEVFKSKGCDPVE